MLDKRHVEWAKQNDPVEYQRICAAGGGGCSAGPYDRGIGYFGLAYALFGICFLSMLFNSGKYLYVCYYHEMVWSTVIFLRFVVITGVLYGLTHLFDKLSTKHPEI